MQKKPNKRTVRILVTHQISSMKIAHLLNTGRLHFVIGIISLIYLATRLVFIDFDVRVLEPAERYFLSATSWTDKTDISISGPLFSIISSWLNTLIPSNGQLVGTRILSVIGGLLAGIAVYRLGTRLSGKTFGLLATCIFWLMPLTVYYSRVASPMMVGLGILLLGFSYLPDMENHLSRNQKVLIGITSLVAVLLNPVLLIFTSLYFFYYLFSKRKNSEFTFKDMAKPLYVWLAPAIGLYVALGFDSFGGFLSRLSQLSFLSQQNLLQETHYLLAFPWYFSYPVIGFAAMGIAVLMLGTIQTKHWWNPLQIIRDQTVSNRYKKTGLLLAAYTFPAVILLILTGFSPASLVILLPVVALVAAFGLFQTIGNWGWLIIPVVLPFAHSAWLSTISTPLREAGSIVNGYVTGNYQATTPFTSLDSSIISPYVRLPVKSLDRNGIHESVVVTDTLRTKQRELEVVQTPNVLTEVMAQLDDRKIVWKYTESTPSFPWYAQNNVYMVYLIPY